MEPGLYRLKTTVLNPSPDRRAKYDWTKHVELETGTKFEILVDETDLSFAGIDKKVRHLRLRRPTNYREIAEGHPLWDLIVPNLEPIEPNLGDLLRQAGVDGEYVLKKLVQGGKINLADVKDALRK